MVFQVTDLSSNTATCSFRVEVDSCMVEVNHPQANAEDLLLSPNPATQSFFILNGWKESPSSMDLINLHGQVVDIFSMAGWPGPFFIKDVPDGIYRLRIIYKNRPPRSLPLIKTK
jgi:hypothetical protein